MSLQSIYIEDERIKAIKQWPESKSGRDIQVFLGFANIYCRFTQAFCCIAAPLTLMLKTTESTRSVANPKKNEGEASSNIVVGNSIIGGGKATNQANSLKRKN